MSRITKYGSGPAYLTGAFGILVSLVLFLYPLFTHYGTDPTVSYSGIDYLLGREFARNVFYIGGFLLLASVAELYALYEGSTSLLLTITLVTLAATYGALRQYTGGSGDWAVLLLLFVPASLVVASLSVVGRSSERLSETNVRCGAIRELNPESLDGWSVVGTIAASTVAGTGFVLVIAGMTSFPNPLGPEVESPPGIVYLIGTAEVASAATAQFATAALLSVLSVFLVTLIRNGSLRMFWLVTGVSVVLGASALRYGSATATASGAAAVLLLVSAIAQTVSRQKTG